MNHLKSKNVRLLTVTRHMIRMQEDLTVPVTTYEEILPVCSNGDRSLKKLHSQSLHSHSLTAIYQPHIITSPPVQP